jgi:flagellar protein FlgJ
MFSNILNNALNESNDPSINLAFGLLGQAGPNFVPQKLNPINIINSLYNNQQNDLPIDDKNPQMKNTFINTAKAQTPNQILPQQPQNLTLTKNDNKLDLLALSDYAKNAYPDNPIMQQVALSQAILESGTPNNLSKLASQNKNLFGIKSTNSPVVGTTGPNSVNMMTTEYRNGQPETINQQFATNNSFLDSFYQHRDLMNKLSRYQPVLNATSPQQAFSALQKAGYATDPNYAKKLTNIFNTYIKPLY